MKGIASLFSFLLFFAAACKSKENRPAAAENDIDALRDFNRAALDGKFDMARTYLLPDSVNENYMDVAERSYRKADPEIQNGYRAASIIIHQVIDAVKDSVTIVIFSNSFKNDHDTLKVVKQGNSWKVDLKYLYEHDSDTLYLKPVIKDSLQR